MESPYRSTIGTTIRHHSDLADAVRVVLAAKAARPFRGAFVETAEAGGWKLVKPAHYPPIEQISLEKAAPPPSIGPILRTWFGQIWLQKICTTFGWKSAWVGKWTTVKRPPT